LSKKINILFLCGWYPSRILPNNGDFIQRHAEAVALKNNVTVLHIISDPSLKKNTEITTHQKNNVKTHIAYIKKTSNPFLKVLLYCLAFLKILQLIPKIEIVHLNSTYPFGVFALFLKFKNKTPYIITEHWTNYQSPKNKNISYIHKRISVLITKNASIICPVSKNLSDHMITFGLKGNYQDVPNVVDTLVFSKPKTSNSIFKILHVSSLKDDHKNISGILNVILNLQNRIQNFEVTIVGSAPQDYIVKSKKLGIKNQYINFIDHLSQEELSVHYSNADLFILFSNYENLPCVILESFSSGTPVISTDVGGISEYFPEGFGSLIRKNSETQLFNEILKYYNDEIKVASFEAMNNYVEQNFSPRAISNIFEEKYKHVLNHFQN